MDMHSASDCQLSHAQWSCIALARALGLSCGELKQCLHWWSCSHRSAVLHYSTSMMSIREEWQTWLDSAKGITYWLWVLNLGTFHCSCHNNVCCVPPYVLYLCTLHCSCHNNVWCAPSIFGCISCSQVTLSQLVCHLRLLCSHSCVLKVGAWSCWYLHFDSRSNFLHHNL